MKLVRESLCGIIGASYKCAGLQVASLQVTLFAPQFAQLFLCHLMPLRIVGQFQETLEVGDSLLHLSQLLVDEPSATVGCGELGVQFQ